MDDVKDILAALPRIECYQTCHRCKLLYMKPWMTGTLCFFCSKFQTQKVTRYALLKETDWFYLQSGQECRTSFYEMYFYLLHRWCDVYGLPRTQKDKEVEEYLLVSLNDI